ncbi:hypothetical protein Taro_054471, partial [Colocasia esculenta]|nr:hypothetical protein [Colocasia esculenta]
LSEPTRGATQSQRSDVVFNSTRDLLPRSWIWVPEHHRYTHPLRFIPTPSAKELGITIRKGIGIAYVTTIQNRHSETVDMALVSRNSVPGPKFPPERVSDSLDYANCWRGPHAEPPSHNDRKSCSTRREISSPGIGIAYVTTIQNRHSETVDMALISFDLIMDGGDANWRKMESSMHDLTRVMKEKKANEFAGLKQLRMSVSEYEAQFARLSKYAPHLISTEKLKAKRRVSGGGATGSVAGGATGSAAGSCCRCTCNYFHFCSCFFCSCFFFGVNLLLK